MKLKQLLIEIPERDHRYIKQCAAEEGISIKKFILQAILLRVIKKDKENTFLNTKRTT